MPNTILTCPRPYALMMLGFSTQPTRLISLLQVKGMLKSKNRLDDIFNYLPLDVRISTSGQPTKEQFYAIRGAGFEVVINLLPHDSENAIADESDLIKKLGMDYIHIPVDFKNPTPQDFEAFCSAMASVSPRRIWIHCAANFRVSAFIYKYRYQVRGEDESIARSALVKIWEPFGAWKKFIAQPV